MRKPKVRVLGDHCILCRRKALPESLGCARHQKSKVDLTFSVAPFVITPQAIETK